MVKPGLFVAAEARSHIGGVDTPLWEPTSVATATSGLFVARPAGAAEARSHTGGVDTPSWEPTSVATSEPVRFPGPGMDSPSRTL